MKKKFQNIATDLATYAKEKLSGYNIEIVYSLENQTNVYIYCNIDDVTDDDIISIGAKYSSDEFKIEILIPEKLILEGGKEKKNENRVDIFITQQRSGKN